VLNCKVVNCKVIWRNGTLLEVFLKWRSVMNRRLTAICVQHSYSYSATEKNQIFVFIWMLKITMWYISTYYYYYNHFTALWILSGTTWVSQYQKKHSLTHLLWTSIIPYLLPPSITIPPSSIYVPDSLFVQSLLKFCFGPPLSLATSYSIHFFTQHVFFLHHLLIQLQPVLL